jgi:hypothetical protein
MIIRTGSTSVEIPPHIKEAAILEFQEAEARGREDSQRKHGLTEIQKKFGAGISVSMARRLQDLGHGQS